MDSPTQKCPVNNFFPSSSIPNNGGRPESRLLDELDALVNRTTKFDQAAKASSFSLEPERQLAAPKPPPIKVMARNLVKSTNKWISNGFAKTDNTTFEKRLEACQGCEFWNAKGFGGTGRCVKCGCSTWAKLRMATEKCPVGKW